MTDEDLYREGLGVPNRLIHPNRLLIHPRKDPAMTEQEIRLRCIELVIGSCSFIPGETVKAARVLADFVLGANDAEVIRAACVLAEKVNDGR